MSDSLLKGLVVITQVDYDSIVKDLVELNRLREKFNRLHVKAPACPKCGNKKLSCPMGHVWETD